MNELLFRNNSNVSDVKAVQQHTAHTSTLQPKAGQPYFQKKGEETSTGFSAKSRIGGSESLAPVFQKNNGPFIQTKLTIGQPGDKYEQEADATADRVVRRLSVGSGQPAASSNPSGSGVVQPKCAECAEEERLQKMENEEELSESGVGLQMKATFESNEESPAELQTKQEGNASIQMKCAACEKEDQEKAPNLQQKAEGDGAATTPSLESRLSSSRGGGSPLPKETRSQMEGAFGADFSQVRVYTDSSAVQMNKELGAQAFTHGSDVYFNAGKYDTGSREGQQLLAHELTHTVQQGGGGRISVPENSNHPNVQAYWGEDAIDWLSDTASDAADWAGDTMDSVVEAAEDLVEGTSEVAGSVTEAASEGLDWVSETAGNVVEGASGILDSTSEAVSEGVDWASETASGTVDWLTSTAGQIGKDIVESIGGELTITESGLEIRIPGSCPISAITQALPLPDFSKKTMVPIAGLPVVSTPPIILTGSLGVTAGAKPNMDIKLGPFCLNDVRIKINPITNTYSVSGGVSFSGGVRLGSELWGGIKGEMGLTVIIPVGGIPVPFEIPGVGVEGGITGLLQGDGSSNFKLDGELKYSNGTIGLDSSQVLSLGLDAKAVLGAYAQLDLFGKNICKIYWQPFNWQRDIAGSLNLSAGLIIIPGDPPIIIPDISVPTIDATPFEQIPNAIKRDIAFKDECPIIDEICNILTELNLLPFQNGGFWEKNSDYGPGRRLDGPKEVYQRDPGRASQAICRGACGPDCDTCEDIGAHIYTDPATGRTWLYKGYQKCNSHAGCRQHDAAFDWAAAEKGETGKGFLTMIMPWHMAANVECACNNPAGNCIAWIAGKPPYDGKLYFADSAEPVDSAKDIPPSEIDTTPIEPFTFHDFFEMDGENHTLFLTISGTKGNPIIKLEMASDREALLAKIDREINDRKDQLAGGAYPEEERQRLEKAIEDLENLKTEEIARAKRNAENFARDSATSETFVNEALEEVGDRLSEFGDRYKDNDLGETLEGNIEEFEEINPDCIDIRVPVNIKRHGLEYRNSKVNNALKEGMTDIREVEGFKNIEDYFGKNVAGFRYEIYADRELSQLIKEDIEVNVNDEFHSEQRVIIRLNEIIKSQKPSYVLFVQEIITERSPCKGCSDLIRNNPSQRVLTRRADIFYITPYIKNRIKMAEELRKEYCKPSPKK